MAGSKKRAAPTAASQRPAKKRKSAEASLLKMKEITAAEDAFSEDEREELQAVVAVTNAADEESDVDMDGMEDHDVVAAEALPVVAPGFRLWDTTSKLASKGELTQTSKYNDEKDEYTHVLKIKHNEAFKLMPLVVTQGPYKGSHVFMLQPQSGFFRFMDFPAEIRTMVYACLFESDGPIRVTTRKRVNQPRRPLPTTMVRTRAKNGWTKKTIQSFLPVALQLLRTNKQILHEAAPVLYGDNKLQFDDLGDMKIFLDTIGSMRHYLRNLEIGESGYWRSKARSTFSLLKDATELRALSFFHSDVCSTSASWYTHYYTTPERLADVLHSALHGLNNIRKSNDSTINVLDLVKVHWVRCDKCEEVKPDFAEDKDCLSQSTRPYLDDGDCKVKCKDTTAHCKDVERRIRKAIASALNIREPSQEL